MADPAAKPVVRRHGFLALIIAGVCSMLAGVFVLLWFKLPAWVPEWVAEHSPFLDPLLRLSLEELSFESRTRERIVGWGPAMVPALLDRISDHRAPVRELAVSCLGKLKDPRAVEALVTLVTADSEVEVVKAAVVALGEIGDGRAVPTLVSMATASPEYEVSLIAIEALGQIGDVRALRPLLGIMRRQDAPWGLLITALAKLPHDAVTTAILPLPPGEEMDALIAFDLARRLVDPRAISALDAAMREGPAEVSRPGQWFPLTARGEAAAASLAYAVHPAGIPTLVAAFSDPLDHVRRRAAVGVLQTHGRKLDQRLIPPLKAALGDPAPSVRQTAAFACRFVRVDGTEPLLVAMLADPDPTTRYLATSGLGNAWASPEAIARLATMLGDEEPKVRRSAVYALAATAKPAALDALLAACVGADEKLRRSIIEAFTSKAFVKDPRVFPWLLQMLADPKKSRHDLARRALEGQTLDAERQREFERVANAWVEEVKPAAPPATK